MHVDVRVNRHAGLDLLVCTPEGESIGTCYAFDTDEKWYEEYVRTITGKIAVVNFGQKDAHLMTRRVDQAQYDVVNRHTGEVLAEVR
jgi:hypothetical protein